MKKVPLNESLVVYHRPAHSNISLDLKEHTKMNKYNVSKYCCIPSIC